VKFDEVPEQDLQSAYANDRPLQRLAEQRLEVLARFEKEEEVRREKAAKLREEANEIKKDWTELGRQIKALRARANRLAKKRQPPRMTEINRRVRRRQGIVREQALMKYLRSQKNVFLKHWNKKQKDNSHEDSEEA